jgi:hypothetical protein
VLHEATSWGIQENDTVYIHTHTRLLQILSYPSLRPTTHPGYVIQLSLYDSSNRHRVGRAKGRWDRIGCVTEVCV